MTSVVEPRASKHKLNVFHLAMYNGHRGINLPAICDILTRLDCWSPLVTFDKCYLKRCVAPLLSRPSATRHKSLTAGKKFKHALTFPMNNQRQSRSNLTITRHNSNSETCHIQLDLNHPVMSFFFVK